MKNFLDYLNSCNSFNTNEFIPLLYSGHHIGFLHQDHIDYITKYKTVFDFSKDSISIISKGSKEQVTAEFNFVNDELIKLKAFKDTHKDEMYRISLGNFASPIFSVKRSSIAFWGFRVYGVHLNGLTYDSKWLSMWVAKRNKNRSAGGLNDHIVCGGQPSDLSIEENLHKEAEEEASIPIEFMKQVKNVGAVSCWVQTGRFLNRFTPFMFDIVLPHGFKPKNKDNSISEFNLIKLEDIANNPDILSGFKSSCYPVLISLLIRYSYIKADHPSYLSLCAMLSNGFYSNQRLAY